MPGSRDRHQSQGLPALVLQTTSFPREIFDEGLPRLGDAEEKPPSGTSAQHSTAKRHYAEELREGLRPWTLM